MSKQRADTTDLSHGSFAEGEADPDDYPEDERLGRFSDGQAHPIGDEEAGRFSEGVEALDDADPEKHVEGRFSDTGEG